MLHYVFNDAPLRDGELLLIDAGCELDGYASDITRTFPVGGRFSPGQRSRMKDVPRRLVYEQAAVGSLYEQAVNVAHCRSVPYQSVDGVGGRRAVRAAQLRERLNQTVPVYHRERVRAPFPQRLMA